MTTSENLTKLSFNATGRSMAALEYAADHLGLSRTDTANRALQLYAALLTTETRQEISFDNMDGSYRRFLRLPDSDLKAALGDTA